MGLETPWNWEIQTPLGPKSGFCSMLLTVARVESQNRALCPVSEGCLFAVGGGLGPKLKVNGDWQEMIKVICNTGREHKTLQSDPPLSSWMIRANHLAAYTTISPFTKWEWYGLSIPHPKIQNPKFSKNLTHFECWHNATSRKFHIVKLHVQNYLEFCIKLPSDYVYWAYMKYK